jgi:hypothetical protein
MAHALNRVFGHAGSMKSEDEGVFAAKRPFDWQLSLTRTSGH